MCVCVLKRITEHAHTFVEVKELRFLKKKKEKRNNKKTNNIYN